MNICRAILVFLFAVIIAWTTRDPVLTALGTALGMIGGSLIGRFPGEDFKLHGFDRPLQRMYLFLAYPLRLV